MGVSDTHFGPYHPGNDFVRSRREIVQRLFTTFADGWPGGGILILRLLAGGALIVTGVAAIGAGTQSGLIGLQVLGAAAGVLLAGGLWTPIGGVLAGIVELSIACTQPGPQPWPIALAALGVSLAMIGPGAWSIDARLYGRKQIIPPNA